MGLGKQLGLPAETNVVQQADWSLGADTDKSRLRKSKRVIYSHRVVIRPGSSSQRKIEIFEGQCKDISSGGCCVIFCEAPRVGDVYQVETPDEISGPIQGKYVRCIRCKFLDEDLFEAGFTFFAPIHIADKTVATTHSNSGAVEDILAGLNETLS